MVAGSGDLQVPPLAPSNRETLRSANPFFEMNKPQPSNHDAPSFQGDMPRRGRLRVFFGYAPGEDTTDAMLRAAASRLAEGTEVVVGSVQPQKPLPFLEGLIHLPPLEITSGGKTSHEFDLDGVLARKPDLVLLDDLAHDNPPGMRHSERWQDVEELLSAGIDVFTTTHVQHVESLANVVEQICGVAFHETFPDHILDSANEITFVDVPPDELIQRMRQRDSRFLVSTTGSLEPLFRRESLLAMRELALRQVADRVHDDVQAARKDIAPSIPWPTREKMLVCVGPSPTSAKVIRVAKRLADRLHAEWVAVHVDTGYVEDATARQRTIQHLRLAESLGAEVVQLSGENIATELLLYARQRNVNRIIVGKTAERRRWPFGRESLVDRLVRDSGNIDVLMVRGTADAVSVKPSPSRKTLAPMAWFGTGLSLATATLVTLAFNAFKFSEANLVMVYLLAVVFVGVRFGALHSIIASVVAVLLYDVLFTTPYYTITVHDTEYLVTFAVMLGVGLLASSLTSRIRRQAKVARRNERRAESLYRLSRRLAAISGISQLVKHAEAAVAELFDAGATIFLPDGKGAVRPLTDPSGGSVADASEAAAAQWVYDHNQPAGSNTGTMPEAKSLYLPLTTPNGIVGVLGIQPEDVSTLDSPDARQLFDTCATQIALALERDKLTLQSEETRVQMETEKLRSSLLSAVSHDLRTPLAAIAGAGSSLATSFDSLDPSDRQELLETICDESDRLTRLVENLLNMTRLSGVTIHIDKQWHPVDEVVGSALSRLQRHLGERAVETSIPDDLPLGHFDAVLIEQVLINLFENAAKYSPPDSTISIEAESLENGIGLRVADRGIGLQPGDEERVFEMFYRGAQAKPDRRGTGLGLSICKAIVEAHGGRIGARNRTGGGTVVWLELPHDGQPPRIDMEPPAGSIQL